MDIQQILIELMRAGLKEHQIAQKLGVNKSTISRWLSGQIRGPNSRHFPKILSLSQEYQLSCAKELSSLGQMRI